MEASPHHAHAPDRTLDGGDLDCGNGLLLLIRRHIDPLAPGQLLEIRSTEISVEEELPAWCRLTGNELMSWTKEGKLRSFLVCKGALATRSQAPSPGDGRSSASALAGGAAESTEAAGATHAARSAHAARAARSSTSQERASTAPPTMPVSLPAPAPAPPIPALAVMGIGSWPRPGWMLRAIHDHVAGRLPEDEFQTTADDAVRLCVQAQLRAGAGAITDGEQRRDSYASFVGGRLDNCQLIPLTDLLPLVDDPEEFQRELRALDVPAADVRHPAVFGKLGRSRPLAVHEARFVRSLTELPIKVALPGPYLLTRTMWMECISDRAYASREELADDLVRVLREELHFLLAEGVAIVQLDEPVLSEVVFTGAKQKRSFMCGALSEKGDPARELEFARQLIERVVAGVPRERIALHMCRGNWTKDETAALAGDYRPLVAFLAALPVGTLFLELCTPRAGEMEILRALRDDQRIGVGVVNQKLDAVEPVAEIAARIRHAIATFGRERVLLTPDCGFATFADNPLSSAQVAEAKLRAIADAVAAATR